MRLRNIPRRFGSSQDHRTVVGYVAGQPFPLIDANDPEVATKIMWNNVFKPITSDDYDLRYYDCDSAREGGSKQGMQLEYFQIGHYAGYDLVGRTEVEPIRTDPDYKATNRLWMFALYPILSPQEIRGTGSSAGVMAIPSAVTTTGRSARAAAAYAVLTRA